ncbi:MAG: tandem-95 repeat protein [Bacteroidetes bacterium]|nr:tandem-95 repeat protein [Bacteroidota bacterium]
MDRILNMRDNIKISVNIVLFVVSLSTLQAQENSSKYSDEGRLINVYSEIKTLTESKSSDIENKLDELSDQELFELAQIASSVNDTTLLYFVLGRELIQRTKTDLPLNLFIEQIRNNAIHNDFKTFLLWLLNKSHKYYSNDEKMEIFNITIPFIIRDKSVNVEQKAIALQTSYMVLGELYFKNSTSIAEVDNYYDKYLKPIMMNTNELPELRSSAIQGVRNLEYSRAIPDLLKIISASNIINNTPLSQSTSIVLGFFKSTEAVPYLRKIIENAGDEYVFASGAVALGDIGNESCLKVLIDNSDRFEGDYVGVAIRKMDELVIELLINKNPDLLPYAIKATEHFYEGFTGNVNYKEVTKAGELEYKSLLKDILFQTQDKNIIKLILDRLSQIVDNEGAKEIISNIEIDDEYLNEWEFINVISNNIPVKCQTSNIPTEEPSTERNNTETQEYGDPGYRENNFLWSWLTGWLGHTGLCAGIDAGNNIRIIEVGGVINVVRHNYWSSMQGDDNYWGANTLNNSSYYMTFSMRRNVMNTAVELVGYSYLLYPVIGGNVDAIWYVLFPGTYISPSEVNGLRCDGLIEYCYEWNNYWVWGSNGTHYDISRTEWAEEHNNFYDWPYNANTELAPVVQGGYAGGSSTHMNWVAQTDVPTYSAGYTINGSTVTVTITATDRSGIHYIKYKVGSGSWSSSPIQSQHPNNSSYTYQFSTTLNESDFVYFYAKDNGGNYPDFADDIYITIIEPPVLSGLPNQSENEDCGSQLLFDLDSYASDPNHSDSQLSFSHNAPSWMGVSISSSTHEMYCDPSVNQNGNANITVTVTDPSGATDTDVFQLTITSLNDSPTGYNTSISTNEDVPATVSLSSSSINDVDDSDSNLRIINYSNPSHGSVSGFGSYGDFSGTYTPSSNYYGSDSFQYRVQDDGGAYSSVYTVSITVNAVNDPPTGYSTSINANEDIPGTVSLSSIDDVDDNDSNLRIINYSNPSHGSISGFGSYGDFSGTYTTSSNYYGSDSFQYRVQDDGGAYSSVYTVSITVDAVNDAPTADNQNFTMDEDSSVSIMLSGSDVENDPLSFSILSEPSHGSLSSNLPNIVYIPNADYNNSDSFTYRSHDGELYSASASVAINVVNINDPPVVEDFDIITDINNPVEIVFTGVDIENNSLVFSTITSPLHGNIDSTLYTPDDDFNGLDSLTYIANDGMAYSEPATVRISVIPIVYPGDTDTDGIVSALDIVPLILYFYLNGPQRNTVGYDWLQSSPDSSWNPIAATYADANGDGIIDEHDLFGIGLNWGKSHTPGSNKFVIDINDSTLVLLHKPALEKLYQALGGDGEPTRQMKLLLERILGIEHLPIRFNLYQNYPNPSNPSTTIKFDLPNESFVTLKILDIGGKLVKTLLEKEYYQSGTHTFTIQTEYLSSGLYLYQISAGNWKSTQKMIILK